MTNKYGENQFKYECVNDLHVGHYIIIQNRPCKILDLHTVQPEKHGAAKAVMSTKDIFMNKRYEASYGTSDKIHVPIVLTNSYIINNIEDDGYLDLFDEYTSQEISTMKLKGESDIIKKLKKDFNANKTLEVKIMSTLNDYKIISYSECK